MTPPCNMCMERHFKCHSYCKNYHDFVEANKKDKPYDVAFYEYLKVRNTKSIRRARGKRK